MRNVGEGVIVRDLEFHGQFDTTPFGLDAALAAVPVLAENRIMGTYEGMPSVARAAQTISELPALVRLAWAACLQTSTASAEPPMADLRVGHPSCS